MKVNLRSLSKGLAYRGEVSGKRQKYSIFEGDGFFAIFSFSRSKPGAGNFNIVDRKALEYVRSRFQGRKAVTANQVAARAKRTRNVPSSLAALNILYVLTALGEVQIDRRRADVRLYFNFRSVKGRGR